MANIRRGLDTIAFTLGLIFRTAPTTASLTLAHSLLAGFAAPFAVWSLQGIIDAVPSLSRDNLWGPLVPWLSLLVAATLLHSSEIPLGEYLSQTLADRVEGAAQRLLFGHALSTPLEAFETPRHYRTFDMGKEALGRLPSLLDEGTAFLTAFSSVSGLIVLLVRAHWGLALALLATVAIRAVVGSLTEVRMERLHDASSPKRREVGYWSSVLSGREAALELRLFGLADLLIARWKRLCDEYADAVSEGRRRALKLWSLSAVLQEIVNFSGVAALLFFTVQGRISLGALVAFLYGIERLRAAAETFTWTTAQISETLAYVANMREFMDLPTERGAEQSDARVSIRPIRSGVMFHGVDYWYPGSEKPAIRGVHLVLRPKERIALVGPNGAGKTTLVRLLLGLFRPSGGRITVDGIDLRQIPPDLWRREATAAFQEYVRYPTTIGENIAYGDVDLVRRLDGEALARHSRVREAARKSGAEAFVRKLKSGYRTPLGKEFEGATELSNGEWQRLALSRAYLRDAQIIVLDEPTAALDPRAEVEVYRRFAEAAKDRAAVFVSHRLGSARLADRIVVLDQGRIVEEGRHEELINRGGLYARMFRIQANWYRDGEDEGDAG